MGFKENIQQRIQKDAVVSNIKGRKVILKESAGIFKLLGKGISSPFKEWKEINPPLTEDGNVHWINLIFGGWRNFIVLIIVLGIVGMFFLAYNDVVTLLEFYQNHPCYNAFEECINNSVIQGVIP